MPDFEKNRGFKMKNPTLLSSAKTGSPIQTNYGSPIQKGQGPFGTEATKKSTGPSGNLRQVITDIKDKAAGGLEKFRDKVFEGAQGPIEQAEKRMSKYHGDEKGPHVKDAINTAASIGQIGLAALPAVAVGGAAHIGSHILKNLKAPSTPSGAFGQKKKTPSKKKDTIREERFDVDKLLEEKAMRKKARTRKIGNLYSKRDEWEPAFPGADHSKEDLMKMTREEIEAYYN